MNLASSPSPETVGLFITTWGIVLGSMLGALGFGGRRLLARFDRQDREIAEIKAKLSQVDTMDTRLMVVERDQKKTRKILAKLTWLIDHDPDRGRPPV